MESAAGWLILPPIGGPARREGLVSCGPARANPQSRQNVSMQYVRRFRMEFSFDEQPLPVVQLPAGYEFIAWEPMDLDRHARTKHRSFLGELDARVFPCLADREGCRRLMLEIASQKTFLPAATWLLTFHAAPRDPVGVDCGIIQGLANSLDSGSIQNVGVIPEHRGRGLGRALVLQSLTGFQAAGVRRVYLEATAENVPAVELYRSVGFRLVRTSYRDLPGSDAL